MHQITLTMTILYKCFGKTLKLKDLNNQQNTCKSNLHNLARVNDGDLTEIKLHGIIIDLLVPGVH